jgi:hypothetical protein
VSRSQPPPSTYFPEEDRAGEEVPDPIEAGYWPYATPDGTVAAGDAGATGAAWRCFSHPTPHAHTQKWAQDLASRQGTDGSGRVTRDGARSLLKKKTVSESGGGGGEGGAAGEACAALTATTPGGRPPDLHPQVARDAPK